jgi:hypothetical protein
MRVAVHFQRREASRLSECQHNANRVQLGWLQAERVFRIGSALQQVVYQVPSVRRAVLEHRWRFHPCRFVQVAIRAIVQGIKRLHDCTIARIGVGFGASASSLAIHSTFGVQLRQVVVYRALRNLFPLRTQVVANLVDGCQSQHAKRVQNLPLRALGVCFEQHLLSRAHHAVFARRPLKAPAPTALERVSTACLLSA